MSTKGSETLAEIYRILLTVIHHFYSQDGTERTGGESEPRVHPYGLALVPNTSGGGK